MSKYDEQFKLNVVKQYLSCKAGAEALGQRHGLAKSLVQRWVASYRQHGLAGLRKKSSQHNTAQFKLSVLKRMWKKEWSYTHTATWFDIRSEAEVGKWERQYHSGGLDALASRPRGRPKKMPNLPAPPTEASSPEDERTREQLLKENIELRAEVAYLKKVDALIQAKRSKLRKKRK
ncbi:MAG: transposase family protein [Betaproteobacteria bacterium]|nr:transposase family protein [Betaproteobacteria bacterium]